MIDAESLQPLLEERTRAMAHRTKICQEWQALPDNTAKMERVDAFEKDYRDACRACADTDDKIVWKLELLVWQVENNI
jgi:hypothetical protein